MPVTDPFWDVGALNHPDEPWANDTSTKEGIRAYLVKRSSTEELRRIGREVRQAIHWALDYQARVDATKPGAGGELSGHPFANERPRH